MVIKDIQSYVARAVVVSEIMSIVQATINVYGGGFSYFNLVTFFFLCLPLLLQVKVSIKIILLLCLYISVILLKILSQGFGEYYIKVIILLVTLPVYVSLVQKTTFNSIAEVCTKYRIGIIFLGSCYIVSWYFLGTYRNASTITIFLMLILGYKHAWQGAAALIFATVMKTQYKIWAALSLSGLIFRNKYTRHAVLLVVGLVAIIFPLLLLSLNMDWANLSSSQTTSLEERLNEARSFLEVLNAHLHFWVYGWPVGNSIEIEGLSERGYMHSAYLWLIATLGLPIFTLLFVFIITRHTVTWRCFLVRIFLLLSSSLTFLLLTNPFCTFLMFANEKKISR